MPPIPTRSTKRRPRDPAPFPAAGLLALVLAGACAPAAESGDAGPDAGPDDPGRTPKVLLIGIDGVRPDVLREVDTPNLDALASDGARVDRARTTRPSVSGPSWSSMLTGVWPDKHGVMDNTFQGERYAEYPDFLTRLERLRPGLSTFAAADWLPLLRAEAGLPTVSDEVDVRHALDGYETGWAEGDERVTALAVEALASSSADALFVYLGNPDETSHEHGSIGPEYRAAIEASDAHVGRLLEAVRARPDYEREDWLILVSTDHGRRADGGHGGDTPEEMTIFVTIGGPGARAALDPPPDSVRIVDVAATALVHMGVDVPGAWALDGRALVSRRATPGR